MGKQHLEPAESESPIAIAIADTARGGELVHELLFTGTHLSPPALEPRYATFTGPSQIRALDARSSSSSGSLRPEAAAARSCMNLSTSSTLVGMGAWVVKASGIGNFGQALERHGSLSPAFKRRGLSPQAQRALPSGPEGGPGERVGLWSSGWPHRLLRARARFEHAARWRLLPRLASLRRLTAHAGHVALKHVELGAVVAVQLHARLTIVPCQRPATQRGPTQGQPPTGSPGTHCARTVLCYFACWVAGVRRGGGGGRWAIG